MHRLKKKISLALAMLLLCLCCNGWLPAKAAEYILDPAQARGRDYTQSEALAKALDQVFSGDIDLFSDYACTAEVSMPLGYVMSKTTQYYVKSQVSGNKISGWQCYIYANGVYNQIFREWVGHANSFAHSETVISGGSNTLTYEMLTKAGVRCGAYIRTTGNATGAYSSDIGHSMIILSYDADSITYLEGNADGQGLVRIATRSWSDFNLTQLSGKKRYISHVVQPKAAVYDEWYPVCAHEQYDGLGVCTACGGSFDWEATLNASQAGQYMAVKDVTPRQNLPYSGASTAQKLPTGRLVQVIGSYQNAFGESWYAYVDNNGNRCFVPAESLQYAESVTLEVVCSDVYPMDHAILEQKSQPVKGTVTANHPITAIYAYLDGAQYATWQASNGQTKAVNLQETDVNRKLSFSTLSKGRHTLTLKLVSVLSEEPVTVYEGVFFMLEVTCSGAHQYESGVCALCGQAEGVSPADISPFLPGDMTGDGKVNVMDTARLYAHIRNTMPITQPDALQCADLNGDGTVNIIDVSRLYASILDTSDSL